MQGQPGGDDGNQTTHGFAGSGAAETLRADVSFAGIRGDCAEQYTKGNITGFLHLYSGQEAVAVGATAGLHKDDYILSAYREHAQAIVRGAEPKRVMAELFGKATGICKGKGGSMHLFDPSLNFMGGYAIVGGQFPIAVGLALPPSTGARTASPPVSSATARSTRGPSTNRSTGRSSGSCRCSSSARTTSTASAPRCTAPRPWHRIHKRTCGYDIPSEKVDGMDVIAVYKAVKYAAEKVRETGRPYFIEATTYRFRGHSMADPAKYRSAAEHEIVEVPRPAAQLMQDGCWRRGSPPREALDAIEARCRAEVEEAVRIFAEESPWPEDQRGTGYFGDRIFWICHENDLSRRPSTWRLKEEMRHDPVGGGPGARTWRCTKAPSR